MKLLFIDTETTGLCRADLPADAPSQPRMVQLAGILCEDNEVISRVDFLIKPEGFTIPEDVIAIHHLTNEKCQGYGVPVAMGLAWFNAMLDLNPLVIGHNIRFDLKILRGELRRLGLPDRYTETKSYCTMESSAPHISEKGWKGLNKCVSRICGVEMIGGHTAAVDVEYTRGLYFALKALEARKVA